MSELREKDLRWQIAFEITTGDLDGKSSGEIADNILSLLPSPAMSGVESVRKCDSIRQREDSTHQYCLVCHGTGEITRELTEHEASEVIAQMLTNPNQVIQLLNTGETLRLKKE